MRGPETGRNAERKTPVMATSQGEPVSSRATQLVTVISIRREKFQAKVESHRRRNSGCSRGGRRRRRERQAGDADGARSLFRLPLSHQGDCRLGEGSGCVRLSLLVARRPPALSSPPAAQAHSTRSITTG